MESRGYFVQQIQKQLEGFEEDLRAHGPLHCSFFSDIDLLMHLFGRKRGHKLNRPLNESRINLCCLDIFRFYGVAKKLPVDLFKYLI